LENPFRKYYLSKQQVINKPFDRKTFIYSETEMGQTKRISFPAKFIAVAIFLYFFIENGTLGLTPSVYYATYRSMRISDFILYALVIYSFLNFREWKDLYHSRSFLVPKLILLFLLLQFLVSAIVYKFNVIEYFFRLKGLWTSFFVFPYLLLLKRNGFGYLVKLIFPVAVLSNILYILSAITGVAFLPDVSIYKQVLPGGLEVNRVYGGTFFGESFFLIFFCLWVTKNLRLYQLIFGILFLIPHILAFGRSTWANFAFSMFVIVVIVALKKKDFSLAIRKVLVLALATIIFTALLMKFMPETEYYIDAISSRLLQGQEDVQYKEGTYGYRVLSQNALLLSLWLNSDVLFGIGMHPMWVYQPQNHEEQLYYNAFSDVSWTAILAAYGVVGFTLFSIFQIYFFYILFKLIKKIKENNVMVYLLMLFFAGLLFDTFITFSYKLLSVGLWGFYSSGSFFVALTVFMYEKHLIKKE
jgi:hypothetical protein